MFPSISFLVHTALANIARHKGRSFLTILSIIIGIATVIATIGIGRGAQEKIRSRLENIGTNALFLYAGGMNPRPGGQKTIPLTQEDAEFFRSFDNRIAKVSAEIRTKETTVVYKNKTAKVSLTGCEQETFSITKKELAGGRHFLAADLERAAPYAIIGPGVAQKLFGKINPIRKTVIIDERPFIVIGALKPKGGADTSFETNMEIFIPLSTCRRLLSKQRTRTVHTIMISLQGSCDMAQVERLLKRAMRARHQLSNGEPDDFTIYNQSSMIEAAQQSSQTFNLFLLIVASLSLLVGGLGVSNIMLVTVTERTREIGIRMALGASPRMIMAQFLTESMILCLVGGILGTLLGIAAPFTLAPLTGWTILISGKSVLLSVCATCLLGLIFGILPAYRAAHLVIVDALNNK